MLIAPPLPAPSAADARVLPVRRPPAGPVRSCLRGGASSPSCTVQTRFGLGTPLRFPAAVAMAPTRRIYRARGLRDVEKQIRKNGARKTQSLTMESKRQPVDLSASNRLHECGLSFAPGRSVGSRRATRTTRQTWLPVASLLRSRRRRGRRIEIYQSSAYR